MLLVDRNADFSVLLPSRYGLIQQVPVSNPVQLSYFYIYELLSPLVIVFTIMDRGTTEVFQEVYWRS